METKRQIEIFSANCPVSQDTIARINKLACESCDVAVLDINDADVAARARTLGIASIPAVVIDGTLAGCCTSRGPDDATLKAAGLGQPLP